MATELKLLCAGAAKGLVNALAPRLLAEADATVGGRFGAVGAMREALLAGEPCDLMVTTAAMADALVAEGRLRGEGRVALGQVRTGVAVRRGAPAPDVSTPAALAATLRAADALFVPDTVRSTAGQHVAKVRFAALAERHPDVEFGPLFADLVGDTPDGVRGPGVRAAVRGKDQARRAGAERLGD